MRPQVYQTIRPVFIPYFYQSITVKDSSQKTLRRLEVENLKVDTNENANSEEKSVESLTLGTDVEEALNVEKETSELKIQKVVDLLTDKVVSHTITNTLETLKTTI